MLALFLAFYIFEYFFISALPSPHIVIQYPLGEV